MTEYKQYPATCAQQRDTRQNGRHTKNTRRTKASKVRSAILWIAVAVLVVSLVALGVISFSYWQGRCLYRDVEKIGFIAPSDAQSASLADLSLDWDALLAINPDTVGWIYIPGTNINYPIVHTNNNETYLTRDFRGSSGQIATFGTIFLDANNAGDFSDANSIIYGHHLNDGSMFADIAHMDNPRAFHESRTVYILSPKKNYRLTTFSLIGCDAYDPCLQTSFSTKEEMTAYIKDKLDRAHTPVSDIVPPSQMEQIFTFSTCDNTEENGRIILFAYVADSAENNTCVGNNQDEPFNAFDGGYIDQDTIANIGDASKDAAA